MTAFVVVLVLGISSLVLLAILVLGLFKHLKLLAASLKLFNEEVTPVLERLRAGSDRARERAGAVAEGRSKLGRDARLGR